MTFIKLGELIEINGVESTDSCISVVSEDILENFRKTAQNLKMLAPKAEDFLYFSAVIMHAAEAAGINEDGTPKLNARGEEVVVGWDTSNNTWRWKSNDPSIRPYKNANGDIFPEAELVKAHKKWVHKPLCIDHKSSSVDHTRGFLVDTYYDRKLKRVVALCALDKANYPDLAKKVSSMMQTSVSMGTAVGKAICSDCATVARTEHDFCDHMRRKSCYGEINVDLNPIELSIVVNGADPKAHIKHIIASANTLKSYVDTKQQEFNKLAQLSYSATLSVNSNNGSGDTSNSQFAINSTDLEQFKADIENACQKLAEIKNSEKDTNDLASNQSVDVPSSDSGLAPPHERYASAEVGVDLIAELKEVYQTIETKLSQMKQNLDKLANTSTNKQEENMSGTNNVKQGYFQGAGGVNEPTPGQAKYPKDPLAEQARDLDKHMVGQSPFPGVGPVDGMHPSPASADQSNELERKKLLARAESEERAQRRQAIVNIAKEAIEKKSYFQGGGGPNEPTPGKQKYPADKMQEMIRNKEDKQMVGQKPFPGVGNVDGLHPSPESADVADELKRKQMLSRASLRAKFAKNAWDVYQGETLILSASVDELSGGRSALMRDTIATKEFGAKLLENVKAHGVDRVREIIKGAQAAVPVEAPVAEPVVDSAPEVANDNVPEMDDTGKSGDPEVVTKELAEKARDITSDLAEAVNSLVGEKAEMGDVAEPGAEMGVAASFGTNTLNSLRKELNAGLTTAIKEVIANLNDHAEELETIHDLYQRDAIPTAQQDFIASITEDVVGEAKSAIANGMQLMTAYVKYARGSQTMQKRAQMESELKSLTDGEKDMTDEHDADNGDDLMAMISDTNSDLDDVKSLMGDEEVLEPTDQLNRDLTDKAVELAEAELADEAALDANDLQAGDLKPETQLKPEMLNSKASRAALRAKLAADATGKQDDGELEDMNRARFSDMLGAADKVRDGNIDLEGKVHDLQETNKAMMDLAKAPVKVRKEAAAIHKLVSEGRLNTDDLDALVTEGLDKEAVAYYKAYYGQVNTGLEFASELSREHVKAQLEDQLNTYKLKLGSAYELAYDMVDRGLCARDRVVIASQVEQIMNFDDASFNQVKNIVAKHEPLLQKSASRIPQVGLLGTNAFESAQVEEDMVSQLSAALGKSNKRMF